MHTQAAVVSRFTDKTPVLSSMIRIYNCSLATGRLAVGQLLMMIIQALFNR